MTEYSVDITGEAADKVVRQVMEDMISNTFLCEFAEAHEILSAWTIYCYFTAPQDIDESLRPPFSFNNINDFLDTEAGSNHDT